MVNKKSTLKEIAEEINDALPDYVAEAHGKFIYICRNNGQFHRGEYDGMGGWATFVGRFTKERALYFLEENYTPF